MNNEQIYFMFSRARSGTGALNSILQQHEDIVCLWEVFHATPDIYKNYGTNHIQQETNYFSWLESQHINIFRFILDNYKNFCNYLKWIKEKFPDKKIIIDVKYNSLHHFNGSFFQTGDIPEFLKFVKHHNLPCINLLRRNKLDVFTSLMLAGSTNIWHTNDISQMKNKTININIDNLKTFLIDTIHEDIFLENIFNSMNLVATFEYDELFVDGKLTESVAQKLEQVLDVSGLSKFSSPFKKQLQSLENVIENFDEVSLFLRENHYNDWLNTKDGASTPQISGNLLSLQESQLAYLITNLEYYANKQNVDIEQQLSDIKHHVYNFERKIDNYLFRYPKWMINLLACFMPKQKNRHHLREKYSR